MAKTLVALVGMKHRGTEALVARLNEGHLLTLIREPMNPYDRLAVQVWAESQHVGYLKSSQNAPVAMAMDASLTSAWTGRLRHKPEGWPMVEIDL